MTDGVADEAIDSFEEFNRVMGAGGDVSPYPTLAALRAQAAVHVGAPDMGVVEQVPGMPLTFTAYGYDAVRTVLTDADTYSSTPYGETMGPVLGRSILEMDEPEHRTYRSILQQAFTRTAMDRWERDLVQPLVAEMIDGFVADGAADLVDQLFLPLPVRVIAALLGLPEADLPEFHRLAVEVISVTADYDRAVAASASLREYLTDFVAERRERPGEDMISVLAVAEHDGQRLTDEEIYSFCRLLLPAGAETTYRSSSNLVFGLLRDPAQFAAIAADRTLLPQAIEEGLRWEPPLLLIMRGATRDTTLAGVDIPAGSTVITNLGAANRDAERWDDPAAFDIYRERKPHISFGHGNHLCLGLHLARMETTVMVNALIDRLPNLRLDPAAEAPYITGIIFRAPPSLRVVWDR
jgi:cytochrome P450